MKMLLLLSATVLVHRKRRDPAGKGPSNESVVAETNEELPSNAFKTSSIICLTGLHKILGSRPAELKNVQMP